MADSTQNIRLSPPPIRTEITAPSVSTLTHPWERWFNEIRSAVLSLQTGSSNDHKVTTSAADTSPGYLVAKMEGGTAATVTETGSHRARVDVVLGTGADTACAGNDSRLSDAREPTLHGISDAAKHSSTCTAGYLLKADANGLPADGAVTDADASTAVSLAHQRRHLLDSTADHTSAVSTGHILRADANGLPSQSQLVSTGDGFSLKDSGGTYTEYTLGWGAGVTELSLHGADDFTAGTLLVKAKNQSGSSEATLISTDSTYGIWLRNLTLGEIPHATTNTNAFLVGDASAVKYRTSAELVSDMTGSPGGLDHNGLGGLQGGTASEYYHLTSAQVSALHARLHALDSTSDHSIGGLTLNYLVKNDGTNLVNATNTDSQISNAVNLAHARQHGFGSTADHTASPISSINALLSDGSMITTLSGEINALATKAPVLRADKVLIEDSAASWAKKGPLANDLPVGMQISFAAPTTVGDYYEFGQYSIVAGGQNIKMAVTISDSGISMAKSYTIPTKYGQTAGAWQILTPVATTTFYGSNTFLLLISVTAANPSVATFRFLKTGGTTAGTVYVTIENLGRETSAWTTLANTGSMATPTAWFSSYQRVNDLIILPCQYNERDAYPPSLEIVRFTGGIRYQAARMPVTGIREVQINFPAPANWDLGPIDVDFWHASLYNPVDATSRVVQFGAKAWAEPVGESVLVDTGGRDQYADSTVTAQYLSYCAQFTQLPISRFTATTLAVPAIIYVKILRYNATAPAPGDPASTDTFDFDTYNLYTTVRWREKQ